LIQLHGSPLLVKAEQAIPLLLEVAPEVLDVLASLDGLLLEFGDPLVLHHLVQNALLLGLLRPPHSALLSAKIV
jgi:hypothetical protein